MSSASVWAAVAIWAAMGMYVSVTDMRTGLIPLRVVWPAGAAVAVLLAAATLAAGEPGRLGWAAAGSASVALVFEAVYRLWPGKTAFGDVRLIIVNSLLAGWWGIEWSWWALMAGAVAAWPAAAIALVRRGRTATVRWAPGLVVGTAAALAFNLVTNGPIS